ncbi:MAG TPA: IPT/TIG domain-containing protein [Planctomycetota bacterium]|nr:IPT/TIG domain-containing protein [Planctomycetota bacterium]
MRPLFHHPSSGLARGIAFAASSALLASAAGAQLANSVAYRLDDFAFAGGGGGAASAGFAGFVALEPLAGAEVTSPSYRATFGFLGCWDPQPTNAPVLFGAVPDCGPLAGGTPLTLSGLNFDKLGSGPTVTVSIGGNVASGVSVASDTLLTCASPSGTVGEKDVTVANVFGSDTLPLAFHYSAGLEVYGTGTPGCTGPELLATTTCPTIGNAAFALTCDHAPANALGLGLVGSAQDFAGHDLFGIGVLLHVDLVFSTTFLPADFASDATGLGTAPLPIPDVPAFLGATLYAQAIWSWGAACSLPPFGLSSSKGLRFTLE